MKVVFLDIMLAFHLPQYDEPQKKALEQLIFSGSAWNLGAWRKIVKQMEKVRKETKKTVRLLHIQVGKCKIEIAELQWKLNASEALTKKILGERLVSGAAGENTAVLLRDAERLSELFRH
tara:strand:+ start:1762 stop:2121 length:360 start_codon:yes stop_codon:yes gene_type:complete